MNLIKKNRTGKNWAKDEDRSVEDLAFTRP